MNIGIDRAAKTLDKCDGPALRFPDSRAFPSAPAQWRKYRLDKDREKLEEKKMLEEKRILKKKQKEEEKQLKKEQRKRREENQK
jgi:hypothetical protein